MSSAPVPSTSTAVYQHVREALPEASTFKLGLAWPLPARALADFAASVDACYVIEEASDYFSSRVRALGIELAEPPAAPLPVAGELKPQLIRASFGVKLPEHLDAATDLPPRPPAFCPGCPLPRLPAPPRLLRAAPPQGHRHRRHRLLHTRRRRALRRVPHGHRHGRLALHGARHGARRRA